MVDEALDQKEQFIIRPIGHVRRSDDGNRLEIMPPYRSALKQLEHFSHVIVVWWADRQDSEKSRSIMQTNPPYAADKTTGVFACRSEYRPNPVALSTCKLLDVDEANGVVKIAEIDALDGTSIVDLKAYFPVCDRVKDAHIPDWLSDWPEWMPDEGIGF